MTRSCNSGSSRISPYTKSYLEGTDHDGSGSDETFPSDAKRPESVGEKSLQLAGSDAGDMVAATADPSLYVPIPAAGADLPISPYACIEQTANDSAGPSLATDASVRPQETVIGASESSKTDGYVPWSST